MSKRSRRPVGFYASFLNSDALDPIFKSKYRPKAKPHVMGVYEVERVVAKRLHGVKPEYFIKWKNYSATENTWEPPEHLTEELITSFECVSVDPLHADECRERLALLFEGGLKSPLGCCETLTMSHDVVRSLFPGMPSDLRGSPYLADENELTNAGLASSLKMCSLLIYILALPCLAFSCLAFSSLAFSSLLLSSLLFSSLALPSVGLPCLVFSCLALSCLL